MKELLEYSVRSWLIEQYEWKSSQLFGEEHCSVEELVVSHCYWLENFVYGNCLASRREKC